jgi:HK97 gp10 family phage protein
VTDFSITNLISQMGINSDLQAKLSGSHAIAGKMITVKTTGLAELDHALAELPGRVARTTLKDAIADASELFRARSAELAPYDDYHKHGIRTRHLKDGILKQVKVVLHGQSARVTGKVGLEKSPKDQSVFYGRFIEFGFGHFPDGRAIDARPFMRPAFEEMKMKAIDVVKSQLASGIEAAARELKG